MSSHKSVEIVLATQNVHKIREFREMFKSLKHLDFISLLNYPDYEPPEETGVTFLENAILKAEHAAKSLNRWALADDSGLVVPALGGRPGIASRRFAGKQATYVENRQLLLQEMAQLEDVERAAYFECCLVLVDPEGRVFKSVTGCCEGYILEKERGSHGFAYDSLFCKHDYDKSFAELEEGVKNRISHRYKAVEKLITALESLKI